MAGIWETLAYLFRTVSTRHQQSSGIYLVFQIFILLAPLWVNAFDYMVLGRMIYCLVPSRQIFGIPAQAIAAGFVTFDFVAFVIQLVGGSIASPMTPAEEQLRAIHIYMGGIGLQQLFIVIFVAFAIGFQLEMRNMKTLKAMTTTNSNWRPLLFTLYATLTCITFAKIRIIFRFVEFSSGSTGVSNSLVTNETYFYVLEAAPMMLAVLGFNIVHPGKILVGPGSEMPGFFATCMGLFRKRRERSQLEKLDGSDNEETSNLQP
ncbi:hypothetical protein Daesc_010497 [Daldinia eschscholtzii]|uniref:Uncharacterized protein n=1 Tax=Daldinia eschscholtzii TaxID=292717 RepID=A0AAX6M8L9_9PEZI